VHPDAAQARRARGVPAGVTPTLSCTVWCRAVSEQLMLPELLHQTPCQYNNALKIEYSGLHQGHYSSGPDVSHTPCAALPHAPPLALPLAVALCVTAIGWFGFLLSQGFQATHCWNIEMIQGCAEHRMCSRQRWDVAVQEDFLACMKLRMANILVEAEAVVAAMAVQHGLRRHSGATPSFSTFLISHGTNALTLGVLMSPLHASRSAIPRLKRPIRSLDMTSMELRWRLAFLFLQPSSERLFVLLSTVTTPASNSLR
jgi:hypothetical protein